MSNKGFISRVFGKLGGARGRNQEANTAGEAEEVIDPTDLNEVALKDAFNKFDKNGDGVIDKQELSDLLVEYLGLKAPPSEKQLGRIMKKVDINENGQIEFNEFKVMMSQRSQTQNQYLEIFRNFDTDKDGFISREELAESMKQVHPDTTDEEIDAIMTSLDVNNDGRISFQEFLNFFVA